MPADFLLVQNLTVCRHVGFPGLLAGLHLHLKSLPAVFFFLPDLDDFGAGNGLDDGLLSFFRQLYSVLFLLPAAGGQDEKRRDNNQQHRWE